MSAPLGSDDTDSRREGGRARAVRLGVAGEPVARRVPPPSPGEVQRVADDAEDLRTLRYAALSEAAATARAADRRALAMRRLEDALRRLG